MVITFIDFHGEGADGARRAVENNSDLLPLDVRSVETRVTDGWHDNHPLKKTFGMEIQRLFGEDPLEIRNAQAEELLAIRSELGAADGESTLEATKRVVAKRDVGAVDRTPEEIAEELLEDVSIRADISMVRKKVAAALRAERNRVSHVCSGNSTERENRK